MNKQQEQVFEFHKEFGCTWHESPYALISEKDQNLRIALIDEELDELEHAMIRGNLVKIADALADLLYVVYGTAVTYGLDMEPIFDEVHRSNMTKVGGGNREDGKVLKGDGYDEPKLELIINKQIEKGIKE